MDSRDALFYYAINQTICEDILDNLNNHIVSLDSYWNHPDRKHRVPKLMIKQIDEMKEIREWLMNKHDKNWGHLGR